MTLIPNDRECKLEHSSLGERNDERSEQCRDCGSDYPGDNVPAAKGTPFADLGDGEKRELDDEREREETRAAPFERQAADNVGNALPTGARRQSSEGDGENSQGRSRQDCQIAMPCGKSDVGVVMPPEGGKLRDEMGGNSKGRREREKNARRENRTPLSSHLMLVTSHYH